MNKNTFLAVVYHKDHFTLKYSKKYFTPIQVGKLKSSVDLKVQGDDTGENISIKNSNFNELTALYWAWKNVNVEYYGLMHYRRYFSVESKSLKSFYINFKYIVKRIIKRKGIYFGLKYYEGNLDTLFRKTRDNVFKDLTPNTIIVPKRIKLTGGLTVKEQFCNAHSVKDWNLLKRTVLKISPIIYEKFEMLENSNEFFGFNMFVMHKDLFLNYMDWLFKVLYMVEKEIELDENNFYQGRVFGFLSERLFTLYIYYISSSNPSINLIEKDIVYLD